MQPVAEDYTIVIPGNWNLAILNPDWIARTLFQAEGVEAQITIVAGTTSLRYRHNQVIIAPNANRVLFSTSELSAENLAAAEAAAERILEQLPVTPVSGVGINFGYRQDQIPENVADIFNAADVAALAARDLAITRLSVTRTIRYDERDLRLRLTQTEDNSLRVHLNYHKAVGSSEEARQAIHQKVAAYLAHGEGILRDIYGLELEADE